MRKISQKIVAVAIFLLTVMAFGIKEAVADSGGGIEPYGGGGTGDSIWCAR